MNDGDQENEKISVKKFKSKKERDKKDIQKKISLQICKKGRRKKVYKLDNLRKYN